jgi:signal transduction histidine kinase
VKEILKVTFANESRYVIDESGTTLSRNIDNLGLVLHESEDIFFFLSSHLATLTKDTLTGLITSQKGFEDEFYIKQKAQWLKLLISPIIQEKNHLFLIQIFDISSEKETSHQLSRYEKSIEKELLLRTREFVMTDEVMAQDGGFLQNFMRGLRHDLLSPSTQLEQIIKYYIKATDAAKKKKASVLIDDSLAKLQRTIRGFSQFVDLHFTPLVVEDQLSLEDSLQNTIAILDSEINQARIHIDVENAKYIKFSPRLLDCIFLNVLSNAIKFRSQDRNLEISIKSYMRNSKTIVEITDNGIGIDMQTHGNKIFDAFTRLNESIPGNGIGLSLVKSIFQKNSRGDVTLESQLDKGTKVSLIFN